MKNLVFFLVKVLKSLTSSQMRYVRLTPWRRGVVCFFDKAVYNFLTLRIRDQIDSITADHIFTDNQYDLNFLQRSDEIQALYNRICQSGRSPLIIDCGANVGFSTLYFSQSYADSSIVAIEPNRENYIAMRDNCSMLKNVNFFNAGVDSQDGFLNIINNDSDNNAFVTRRASDAETGRIESISINSILSSSSGSTPFIIKIDIEGFEEFLFCANTEWVKDFPIIIIETHDWMIPRSANSSNFLKVISQHNRDFIHKDENIFSISNDI